jgi:NhaA family Na+:H+ antiporter
VIRLLRFAIEHYLVVPLGVVVALVWANTASESYYRVGEGLSFIVNDIGMAFALALLMQEVVEAMLPGGTLHPWRRGALPLIAAAGGALGAVAMYQAVVSAAAEPVLALGWPIAGAVDIAVGFLVARSIFGRHAAVSFLLLLAIASDTIGLVLISQRYPVSDVYPGALALIVVAIAAAIALRRSRVRRIWPYVLICGTVSWFGCF